MDGLSFLNDFGGPPKTRGRKLNFSMAQLKEKLDITDGRQLSLKGLLRATMTPLPISK